MPALPEGPRRDAGVVQMALRLLAAGVCRDLDHALEAAAMAAEALRANPKLFERRPRRRPVAACGV